jgi:hypothetical protein
MRSVFKFSVCDEYYRWILLKRNHITSPSGPNPPIILVDGEKIEVLTNTVPLQGDLIVLIEDRFNMEQPLRVATMREAKTGFLSHFLAKTPKDGALPIYIPSIPRMVEALIRQLLCCCIQSLGVLLSEF